MVEKITGMEIADVDGVRCVVFTSSGGRFAFPARGVDAIFKQINTLIDQKDREEGARASSLWTFVKSKDASTVNVDLLPTTAGQIVVLTMDRGKWSETSFSLDPAGADETADQLRSAAALARSSGRPSQN